MVNFDENNNVISKQTFDAIIVGLEMDKHTDYYMDELAGLVEAAGGSVCGRMTQNLPKPNTATFIGKGKVEELREAAEAMEVDTIVFNDELSGMQIRNLEEAIGKKVIDRTILILDIFADRATSKEGKLQVELAQLKYRLPRLIGFGKSLSRQGGGVGTRGPGEKKMEVDRRHIESRMLDIRRELDDIVRTRQVQRSKREKGYVPVVALVGYTNVGKSAIMNSIMNMFEKDEKQVEEKDMLFATLDAKHRSVELDNQHKFILVDTVGFVSKLPHSLVDAFKSTLEEAVYADLIVHVVDLSFEKHQFQKDVTDKVLKEIGAASVKSFVAYNKIDMVEENLDFKETEETIFISAKEGTNLDQLLSKIKAAVFELPVDAKLIIPYNMGHLTSFVCENSQVITLEYKDDGAHIHTLINKKDYGKVREYDTV